MKLKWTKVKVFDLMRDPDFNRGVLFSWWILNNKYLFGTNIDDYLSIYKRAKSEKNLNDYKISIWKTKYNILVLNNKLAKVYYG